MTGNFLPPRHYSPAPQYTMPNTYLDKAIEAVPELGNRISLFTKKLRLAQYVNHHFDVNLIVSKLRTEQF